MTTIAITDADATAATMTIITEMAAEPTAAVTGAIAFRFLYLSNSNT